MTYIFEKPQFHTFQTTFRSLAAQKCLTPSDMILYNAIRGKSLKNGFSPITNPTKLANGCTSWDAYNNALREARYRIKHAKELLGLPLTDDMKAAFQTALEA